MKTFQVVHYMEKKNIYWQPFPLIPKLLAKIPSISMETGSRLKSYPDMYTQKSTQPF